MGEFEDREHGFEAKFAHDQEVNFKARARRDALAARWVAGQLGLAGAESESYVQGIVALAVQKDHEKALVDKILKDFQRAGIAMSEHRLRRELSQFLDQALAQVKQEVKE